MKSSKTNFNPVLLKNKYYDNKYIFKNKLIAESTFSDTNGSRNFEDENLSIKYVRKANFLKIQQKEKQKQKESLSLINGSYNLKEKLNKSEQINMLPSDTYKIERTDRLETQITETDKVGTFRKLITNKNNIKILELEDNSLHKNFQGPAKTTTNFSSLNTVLPFKKETMKNFYSYHKLNLSKIPSNCDYSKNKTLLHNQELYMPNIFKENSPVNIMGDNVLIMRKYFYYLNKLLGTEEFQETNKNKSVNSPKGKKSFIQDIDPKSNIYFKDEVEEYLNYLRFIKKEKELTDRAKLILEKMKKNPVKVSSPIKLKEVNENKFMGKILANVMRKVIYYNEKGSQVTEDQVVNLIKEEADMINSNLDLMMESVCQIKNFSTVITKENTNMLLPFINSMSFNTKTKGFQTISEAKLFHSNTDTIENLSTFYTSDGILKSKFGNSVINMNLKNALSPINERDLDDSYKYNLFERRTSQSGMRSTNGKKKSNANLYSVDDFKTEYESTITGGNLQTTVDTGENQKIIAKKRRKTMTLENLDIKINFGFNREKLKRKKMNKEFKKDENPKYYHNEKDTFESSEKEQISLIKINNGKNIEKQYQNRNKNPYKNQDKYQYNNQDKIQDKDKGANKFHTDKQSIQKSPEKKYSQKSLDKNSNHEFKSPDKKNKNKKSPNLKTNKNFSQNENKEFIKFELNEMTGKNEKIINNIYKEEKIIGETLTLDEEYSQSSSMISESDSSLEKSITKQRKSFQEVNKANIFVKTDDMYDSDGSILDFVQTNKELDRENINLNNKNGGMSKFGMSLKENLDNVDKSKDKGRLHETLTKGNYKNEKLVINKDNNKFNKEKNKKFLNSQHNKSGVEKSEDEFKLEDTKFNQKNKLSVSITNNSKENKNSNIKARNISKGQIKNQKEKKNKINKETLNPKDKKTVGVDQDTEFDHKNNGKLQNQKTIKDSGSNEQLLNKIASTEEVNKELNSSVSSKSSKSSKSSISKNLKEKKIFIGSTKNVVRHSMILDAASSSSQINSVNRNSRRVSMISSLSSFKSGNKLTYGIDLNKNNNAKRKSKIMLETDFLVKENDNTDRENAKIEKTKISEEALFNKLLDINHHLNVNPIQPKNNQIDLKNIKKEAILKEDRENNNLKLLMQKIREENNKEEKEKEKEKQNKKT